MIILIRSEYGGISTAIEFQHQPIYFKEKFAWQLSLRELIDNYFTTKNYGEGLKSYFFIPRIFHPSWQAHEEIYYQVRRKHFIYSPVITAEDFEFYKTCSLLEWQQLMAKNFLIGIEKMGTFPVKKFDYQTFHKEVQEVLQANGFLE
jgi:hypothetical protein